MNYSYLINLGFSISFILYYLSIFHIVVYLPIVTITYSISYFLQKESKSDGYMKNEL